LVAEAHVCEQLAKGHYLTAEQPGVGMRGIPVKEEYRGIKSDGIIYRGRPKYCGIPPSGIDVQ